MIDLRWEGDDKNQYLFAGTNETELVWLEKRQRHWAAVVWLPGVDRGREYNTLAAHKANMEMKVRHWFARANQTTARDDALTDLKRCATGDTERDHANADKALCNLLRNAGYADVADAFEAVDKWYA